MSIPEEHSNGPGVVAFRTSIRDEDIGIPVVIHIRHGDPSRCRPGGNCHLTKVLADGNLISAYDKQCELDNSAHFSLLHTIVSP
jgi:hypothetical protein